MMRKLSGIGCTVLFGFAVLIVPALHQAGGWFAHDDCAAPSACHHQDHGRAGSDSDVPKGGADDCQICHLASLPTIAACPVVAVAGSNVQAPATPPAAAPLVSRLTCGTSQARAPPASLCI